MKIRLYLCCALAAMFSACVLPGGTHPARDRADTATATTMPEPVSGGLVVIMSAQPAFADGDSIRLRFTVRNDSSAPARFCIWHTPFERLSSNYLEILDEQGAAAPYQGILARRVMPPPESSYVTLQPRDSISANVNLLAGYAIRKPGTYTVTYVGGVVSGLEQSNTVSFRLQ